MSREHIALKVGPIETNCYIVYAEGQTGCVVIDPGDDAADILRVLTEKGLKPEYIFLTHGHYDHVTAAAEVKNVTGAKTVIHAEDTVLLKNTPIDVTIKGGEQYSAAGLDFKWMHTPGHTRGSSVIICGDALYTGDTLFFEDCGRCDLPGGSFETMLDSLKRLSEIDGDYGVFPGHDRFSTLGYERENNEYMLQAVKK